MITIFDVALSRGVKKDADGAVNGAEFERLGLPMMGGCQSCHATIAAYNSYPSQTGYIRCKECLFDLGFDTVKEYEEFEKND